MAFLLLCLCLLPIFYFLPTIFLRRNASISNPKRNRPPGSTGWPLLGEALLPVLAGLFWGKPSKWETLEAKESQKTFSERMKKFSADIFTTSILGETMAVFCGVSGNKFLFFNESKLVSISWPRTINKILPNMKNNPDMGQQSTRLHNILSDFFNPQNKQKCVGIIDQKARKHLDSKWDSQKEVTVLPLVWEYTFAVTCKIFLSIEDPKTVEEMAKPFHALTAGILSLRVNIPGTSYNKAIKAASVIHEKLYEFIRERKAHLNAGKSPWSDDILKKMITLEDDVGGFMSEIEIADQLLVSFLASQDPATTTITFMVKYLAEHHRVHKEVLKEQTRISKDRQQQVKWEDVLKMKYSGNVVNEVMRLMPPSQGGLRKAFTDFTYCGFSIPEGSTVFWTPHTTYKDPNYFPDPEKVDPSRFEGKGPVPYSFVPYGGGLRICPGKDFSQIIILVFLHNLVQRFKWEKLLPNEKIVVQPVPTPVKGLPIRLCPL